MRSPATVDAARDALGRFGIEAAAVSALGGGLINDTFAVEVGAQRFVLQRVHPVFEPEVHHNIVAVTEHLASKGMVTPQLRRAPDGRPWVTVGDDVWRVMTRIEGHAFDTPHGPTQVEAAGRLLGRFHAALRDLDHAFVAVRAGVHDTPAHLARLESALDEHRSHRLYDRVAPLAQALLAAARSLPRFDELPARRVHGDPKFNNVMFAGSSGPDRDEAVCMIDLDTVGEMPLHLELGDAWRSWCNRSHEDSTDARFDLGYFEASLRGYAAGCGAAPSTAEREALAFSTEWITVELAARFAADALAESYFGWDRQRFPAAGEHNLVRAQGQWALHRAVAAQRAARATALTAVWPDESR